MTPRSSKSFTRRWQGETDSPTLSASSTMVMRLSACRKPRIFRSIESRAGIGMKPYVWAKQWDIIPKTGGMAPKFKNFAAANRIRILALNPRCPRHCHADRSRTSQAVVRAGAQGAVAVVLDHPPRQPHPSQHRWAEGRRSPGLVRLARDHHVGTVFFGAAPRGPRRREAACEPGV